MRRFSLPIIRDGDGRAVYDEIPTWGPYPGVSEALKRLAQAYPLVIVTNSDDAHASRLVENLQAPFEVVITAERMRASTSLGCARSTHGGTARRGTR